jgi:hypothetical protein
MKPKEYIGNEYNKVWAWYQNGLITEQEWQEFAREFGRVSSKKQ